MNGTVTQNQYPHWLSTDLWLWEFIEERNSVDFSFGVENLISGKTAKVISKNAGIFCSAGEHIVSLDVNGNSVCSDTFHVGKRSIMEGTYSSNILNNGQKYYNFDKPR